MLPKRYCYHYKIIKTYCSKKVIMTNTVIRQVSKCTNCAAEKSRFLKQMSNKKSGWDKINPNLFIN